MEHPVSGWPAGRPTAADAPQAPILAERLALAILLRCHAAPDGAAPEHMSERDLGPQPLGELMHKHGLAPHHLVAASSEQITHKMVARARKGRRLTPRVMGKILRALNAATGERYALADLFDYAPGGPRDDESADGDADGAGAEVGLRGEGRYVCPSCGEEIVVPIALDDRGQDWVEDCPVCCRPVLLHLDVDERGDVTITPGEA